MLPPNIGENRTCQLRSAEMSETNPNDKKLLLALQGFFQSEIWKSRQAKPFFIWNLFKSSKRQDCFGVRLSEICSQVGLKA